MHLRMHAYAIHINAAVGNEFRRGWDRRGNTDECLEPESEQARTYTVASVGNNVYNATRQLTWTSL